MNENESIQQMQLPDLAEAANEVRRELTVRQRVYPRLVDDGKLTQREADRRTAAMQTAWEALSELVRSHQAASNN